MKQSHSVPRFRQPCLWDRMRMIVVIFFWLMPFLCPLVSKLRVASLRKSLKEMLQNQPKWPKCSQPPRITKKLSRFRFMKAREQWQKITTIWVRSNCKYLQRLLEFLKSKLYLKSIRMVFLKWLRRTKRLTCPKIWPLSEIKVASLRMKLPKCNKMPSLIRIKIKLLEIELRHN